MIANSVKTFLMYGRMTTDLCAPILKIQVRYMKNKRRGLKQQPRKKPLDIEKKIRNPDKYEQKMHFDNLTKGELFLPESCKAKKLAMLCNRLFYFDINDEDILERYANRAVVIANSMNTKEMSLILNTMAKMNHKNEKLLETFAKHIPRKLHKAVPQDISLLLNAYAHFHYVDKELFSRICEEIPHKIPYFEPSHIASVINAFSKLQIKDKIIIDDMTDEIVDKIREFNTKALTNVINSFAKLNYINENKKIIWWKFLEAIQELSEEFNFLEITLILNAFSKRKIKTSKGYNMMESIIKQHIFEKKSIHIDNSFLLCIVLHSFALTNHFPYEIFYFTKSFFSKDENYSSLSTQHFSQLIYGYTILTIQSKILGMREEKKEAIESKEISETDDIFIETFTNQACHKIENNQLNEKTLSTIAYCFAKLELRNAKFFSLLSACIIKQKLCLTPQSLSLICYSYAKLMIKSEMLFYFLSMQIFEKINIFTKQGLSIIMTAYAKLKIFNVKLLSMVNRYLLLYVDHIQYQEGLVIGKQYEEAFKCLEEECVESFERVKQMETQAITKYGELRREMQTFTQALRERMQSLEKQEIQNKISYISHDKKIENKQEEDEVESMDDDIFSIFKQNDILSNEMEHEDKHKGSKTSKERNDELITSDQLMHYFDDTCDSKKKEDTLKWYEQMFTQDENKKETEEIQKRISINEDLTSKLQQMIENKNKCIEENSKESAQKKDTKTLIDMMYNNRNKEIHFKHDQEIQEEFSQEQMIKSAEQVEAEFIKSYIEENQNENNKRNYGRSSKNKKKLDKILNKNYEPVQNISTLQSKWSKISKK